MTTPRLGLALGGGGARGLAHIPVVEALDDMGLRPSEIAGSSIGALVGAGVAAGMSGRDIRRYVLDVFGTNSELLHRFWRLRPQNLAELMQPRLIRFDPERVLKVLLPDVLPSRFEDLAVPLTVVATDFFGWEGVSLSSGPLLKGIAASAALPILFNPVAYDDRLLIDGGIFNPLPFDVLSPDLDVVVAVDVVGGPERHQFGSPPTNADIVFGTAQLMLQSVLREKLKTSRPDVLVRPPVNTVRVLDFMRAVAILEACDAVKETVKRDVEQALERRLAAPSPVA